MIGLELDTRTKLLVIWIIIKWCDVVDLILHSIWIILVFYHKFYAFEIILLCIENKWNKHHNKIIDISSFQIGINNLFSSTGFYLKSNVVEGNHKGKNMFLISGHFFSQTFLRLWHFFLVSGSPINSSLQW